MFMLSIGLLAVGVTAVVKYPVSSYGYPYYTGCFIVGCLALGYGLVCSYIAFKGAIDTNNETNKKEVGYAIACQFILSSFLSIGCLAGTVFAGFWLSGNYSADNTTEYQDKVRTLSGATIAGCILTLGVNVFGMCTACNYGSHFGMNNQHQRSSSADETFETAATVNTSDNLTQTGSIEMGVMSTGSIHTLQEQNRLLQEQVRFQQELLNQQQGAYVSTIGFNAPASPNYSVSGVFVTPEHQLPSAPAFPSAPPPLSDPPPSYDSLK
ncbi:uncharacterized protein LOC128234159 isoform X2 [Mya arenaria]|nr:uncharacterized protein LOC128234159 isoform X2 [Mya arenaria]